MQKKVQALNNFPPPTKQKECLAFLGSLNYYRASLPTLTPDESAGDHPEVRNPAEILDPLYKIATCKLGKTDNFVKVWNSSKTVQNAFVDAKTLLQKAVTLNYPVPSAHRGMLSEGPNGLRLFVIEGYRFLSLTTMLSSRGSLGHVNLTMDCLLRPCGLKTLFQL